MIASFIVRLLDADGNLLSWTEVLAKSFPQGRPRSTPFKAETPSQFVIERDGTVAQMTVHWADLDVARVAPTPMGELEVKAGQVYTLNWIEPVWMVKGSEVDVPLPAVTVRRAIAIAPPPAAMGAAAP